jgi:hypothetical protein
MYGAYIIIHYTSWLERSVFYYCNFSFHESSKVAFTIFHYAVINGECNCFKLYHYGEFFLQVGYLIMLSILRLYSVE